MIGLTPTFVLDGVRALVGWDYTNLTSVPLDDPDAVITVQAGDADVAHAIRLRSGELITAAEDGRLRAWALPGLDAALEYQPLPTGPSGLCELADGRFAAWYAGRVAVFRPGRAEPETVLDPADPIVDVRAAPDGGIVYRTLDHRVASWDGRHRWSVSHDDGREPFRLLAPSRDEVLLWSVHERWVLHAQPLGSALVTLGGGSVYGVALHPAWPSRSHAIGWGDSGEVAVWDLAQATARTAAMPASAIHGLVSTSPGELVA
jgi:hypothetical protein